MYVVTTGNATWDGVITALIVLSAAYFLYDVGYNVWGVKK